MNLHQQHQMQQLQHQREQHEREQHQQQQELIQPHHQHQHIDKPKCNLSNSCTIITSTSEALSSTSSITTGATSRSSTQHQKCNNHNNIKISTTMTTDLHDTQGQSISMAASETTTTIIDKLTPTDKTTTISTTTSSSSSCSQSSPLISASNTIQQVPSTITTGRPLRALNSPRSPSPDGTQDYDVTRMREGDFERLAVYIVPDVQCERGISNRADKTLPRSLTLKPSMVYSTPNVKTEGVWSTGVIPRGTRFGPFEGVPTSNYPNDKNTARYFWRL